MIKIRMVGYVVSQRRGGNKSLATQHQQGGVVKVRRSDLSNVVEKEVAMKRQQKQLWSGANMGLARGLSAFIIVAAFLCAAGSVRAAGVQYGSHLHDVCAHHPV